MAVKKTVKAAAMEMVDVVDKADKVIGTMTEVEAMAGKARFRIVHVIVTDADGALLVQWRKANKTLSPRMFTASAAGKVMAGESYEEAAMRELNEEMGAKGVKLRAVGNFKTPLANGRLFTGVWDGEPTGWEAEADAVDYWNREEAEYMLRRFPYLISTGFELSLKLFLKETE